MKLAESREASSHLAEVHWKSQEKDSQSHSYPSRCQSESLPLALHHSTVTPNQLLSLPKFGGDPASRIDVEDWIRDMQQMLDVYEVPATLQFAAVLHHLEGRAKMLVLELPLKDQCPTGAFEKLRTEYGHSQLSLNSAVSVGNFERSNEFKTTYSMAAVLRTFKTKSNKQRSPGHKDFKDKPLFINTPLEKIIDQKPPAVNKKLVIFKEQQKLPFEIKGFSGQSRKPPKVCDPTPEQVSEKDSGDTFKFAESQSRCEQDPALLELTTLVKQLAMHQMDQMERLQRMESLHVTARPEANPAPDNTRRSNKSDKKLKTNLDNENTKSFNCERSCTCYLCGQEGHKVKGSKSRKQPYRASMPAALLSRSKHFEK